MEKKDKAADLFLNGLACSQAVLAVYGEKYGLDKNMAVKLARGLAAGITEGRTCGALTGGILVLGLAEGDAPAEEKETRYACYLKVKEFNKKFLERHDSTQCLDLLGEDLSTEEGRARAAEKDLFKTVCPAFVKTAASILDDMLS